MTTDQLKQIVEDAKKATPGMWDVIRGRSLLHVETRIDNPSGAGIPICSMPNSKIHNSAHIANCSPETIIAMAEELIRAREALDAIKQLACGDAFPEYTPESLVRLVRCLLDNVGWKAPSSVDVTRQRGLTEDPVEKIIERALDKAKIPFRRENENEAKLDFYLFSYGIYIECKGGHSERTTAQLKRAHNVIVVQGLASARLIAYLIGKIDTLAAIDKAREGA